MRSFLQTKVRPVYERAEPILMWLALALLLAAVAKGETCTEISPNIYTCTLEAHVTKRTVEVTPPVPDPLCTKEYPCVTLPPSAPVCVLKAKDGWITCDSPKIEESLIGRVPATIEKPAIPTNPTEAHRYAEGVLGPQFHALFNEWSYRHPQDRQAGSGDHVRGKVDAKDVARWHAAVKAFRDLERAMKAAGY